MVAILFKFVMILINALSTVFVNPIINTITAIIPNSEEYILYILNFFAQGGFYIPTVLRWFLITKAMMLALFGYFLIKFSIWVIMCGVRAGLLLYNTLKP